MRLMILTKKSRKKAAFRQFGKTPTPRKTEQERWLTFADGSYDSATAQALKNLIDIGNVYDAIFEMGKAQMAGIRVIQQKAGALSALSKKGHTGVVKSKR